MREREEQRGKEGKQRLFIEMEEEWSTRFPWSMDWYERKSRLLVLMETTHTKGLLTFFWKNVLQLWRWVAGEFVWRLVLLEGATGQKPTVLFMPKVALNHVGVTNIANLPVSL